MRKSIAAALIAASPPRRLQPRAGEDGGPTVSRRLSGRQFLGRSRSPGLTMWRSAPAPTSASARRAAKAARAHHGRGPGRQARHPPRKTTTACSTAAGPIHGKAHLRRDRPAAQRRDHRRIGRYPDRQGHRRRLRRRDRRLRRPRARIDRGPVAETRPSPARAASRPAPATRRPPNMRSRDRAASTPPGSPPSSPRSRSPVRAASRPTPPAPPTSTSWARATSTSTGGAKCNVSKAGSGNVRCS